MKAEDDKWQLLRIFDKVKKQNPVTNFASLNFLIVLKKMVGFIPSI